MLLRMRGIVSGPARSFIGMTAARTGAPLGTSRVCETARTARVCGTARTARGFGTARAAGMPDKILQSHPRGRRPIPGAPPPAIWLSPFRMVRIHPIGMVPMPPPVVVIGAFVRSAPTPKRVRSPERRPEPVRVMLVVVPPPTPPFHHPFRMIRIHPLGIIAMPPLRIAPNVAVVVIAEMLLAWVLSHRRSGHQCANYGTQQ